MKHRTVLPLVLFILLWLFTPALVRADFLVLAADPEIWRFDSQTGTLLDGFAGGNPESYEGIVQGPDGSVYATGNVLGTGDVYHFDRNGHFLGRFNASSSTNGSLEIPNRLAFGPDGDCYVIGNTNFDAAAKKVFRFNNGVFTDYFVTNAGDARDLAFGPGGQLYISDHDRGIVRYDGTTGAYIDTVVPLGAGGLPDVQHFTFGPDGNLYVCSWLSNAVFRFDGSTGGFIDCFVTPGSGGLDEPTGIAFAADDNLYLLTFSYTSSNLGAILEYDGQSGVFLKTVVTNNSSSAFPRNRALVDDHELMFLPSLPQLGIATGANGTVRITWPLGAGHAWTLTRRDDLTTAGSWTAVTNVPVTNGINYLVTLPRDALPHFFRLKQP